MIRQEGELLLRNFQTPTRDGHCVTTIDPAGATAYVSGHPSVCLNSELILSLIHI